MLTSSFIHLKGIQTTSEQNIWQQKIYSWDQFQKTPSITGMSWKTKRKHDVFLKQTQDAYNKQNLKWFHTHWPKQHTWRLFNAFHEDALYLDIETEFRGAIILIGLYFHNEFHYLLVGDNLNKDAFKHFLSQAKLLVTFNGRSFDWPVLKEYFGITLTIPHIDLLGVCAQAGYKGGLKAIEEQLNIARSEDVKGFNGVEAAYACERYKRTGDKSMLQTLITYNRYDTENLKTLAQHVIPQCWKQIYNPNASVNCANCR